LQLTGHLLILTCDARNHEHKIQQTQITGFQHLRAKNS